MLKEDAAQLLNVSTSVLKAFDELDSYNGNQIAGFVSHQSDNRYGALIITKVNGIDVEPQIIYATPKLKYPFSTDGNTGERKYNYPKFKKIVVYEKLDGTNILAYSYKDANGNSFVTFKTRLTPVLKESKFGDFKGMWDKMLEKYQMNFDVVKSGMFNLSFELFGSLNPHLINYDVELDTKLLFVVNELGIAPASTVMLRDCVLPAVAEINNKSEFVEFYNKYREKAEKENTKLEDGTINGTEGFVFYVLTEDNNWIMYKVKPESVEEIHWTSDSIPYNVILATTWNAVENARGLILPQDVVALLLEEFDEAVINKSTERINKAVWVVNNILSMRAKILSIFEENKLTSDMDKRTIMRIMSKEFKSNEMQTVYTNLKQMGKIKES